MVLRARATAQDKLWLGQWDHGSAAARTAAGSSGPYALHAWFDKQLAQRKVNTGPPIELFMSDDQSFSGVRAGARTEILTAATWPVADDKLTSSRTPTAA